MKVLNVSSRNQVFCAEQKKPEYDKNPISKKGEQAKLLKATVAAGLVFGGRFLFYLWENGITFEELYKIAVKLVNKNKQKVTGTKKELLYLGAFGGVVLGFVAAIGAVYTLVKAPEIMYKGKVNAFVKDKDMDVYVKGNKVEKELYDQMNEKTKNANEDEKKILSQQYLKLKAAKNQTPDFVNIETKK